MELRRIPIVWNIVVLEVHIDAEASAQRRCEHTAACGSSHESEGVKVNLYASCRRALVNHDIDAVVLHGRVEIFLHYGRQTVYLINEQHIVRLQRGEQTCQVARLVEHRARGDLESHAQLIGDDVAQCRLAQSGRPM